MKEAYKRADGKKVEGKRVVVDVERGRTVPNWYVQGILDAHCIRSRTHAAVLKTHCLIGIGSHATRPSGFLYILAVFHVVGLVMAISAAHSELYFLGCMHGQTRVSCTRPM